MRNLTHTVTSSILALALLFTVGCAKEDWTSPADARETIVSFSLSLDHGTETRATTDNEFIDHLTVVAKDSETGNIVQMYDNSFPTEEGLPLRLIHGRKYQILFWAHNNANTAYTISEEGVVSVDYTDYLNSGFEGMKNLDAFSAVIDMTVGTTEPNVTLGRSIAQLNFVDKENAPQEGSEFKVSLSGLATAFKPFEIEGKYTISNDPQEFIFKDFPTDKLVSGTEEYNHLANIYLFPVRVQAAYQLDNQDKKTITIENLTSNKRTNIVGSFVQAPEDILTSLDQPQLTSLEDTYDKIQNRYIIDECADLIWLSNNGNTLDENKTFEITKSLNMNALEGLKSIQLPAGSTIDGNGKTIKNLKLGGAVFSDAMDLTVTNLNIESVSIEATAAEVTHVGVLVNTLKGSSAFSNVTVKDASVKTSNGAAGGIVGYIAKDENSTDPLNVTFDNCHVVAKSITGSISEGNFVGLFRGYDNRETLTFNDNCSFMASEAAVISENVSPYTEGNEVEWLSDNDYSKFNGWLGNEEYYRGIINYGANRFIPKWDGTKEVTPLTETGATVIYSAFDLAYAQGKSLSLVFRESVDMASKTFEPLTYITDLHGNDNAIYNLKVDTQWDGNAWSGGAFARRCKGGTFDNITFKNADVKVTHSTDDGDAYAAIVCATLEGDPVTIHNVKVMGGSLYGVNKMGGIAGYIVSDLNCTDCVVDGLSIENYDSGGKDSFGFKANGEIGGMFGFLAANATISGSYVKNTTLNCIGVNNGYVLWYKYAGRHINEFIGDIRTTSGQNIVITYTDSNFTGNQYKNRKDQYSQCNKLGHCYYTNISAFGYGIQDTKGTVTVNGSSITVAKNY